MARRKKNAQDLEAAPAAEPEAAPAAELTVVDGVPVQEITDDLTIPGEPPVDEDLAAPFAAADSAGSPPAGVLDEEQLIRVIESLLFASDRPLALADLKRLVGERDGRKLTDAVELLAERKQGSGIHVVAVANGWQLRTNPAHAPWIGKLLQGRPVRLSRAMLETLAIVAYRQPVTRPEIDEIRGVDCGPVLKTLLDRTLIRIIGKKEEVGRPLLYGTTPDFLRTFNLKDLTELPTLREFHELGAEERARVETEHGAVRGEPELAVEPVPSAGTSPFSPGPQLSPDPEEDGGLLDELEQAAQAAVRASGAAEPPAS